MFNVYTLEQSEQWDSIVRSFSDYDVFYLSGYVKAFKIHGDGEPILFSYEENGTRGINVVLKRDIALCELFKGKVEENTWFDLSSPYGYAGWLIEGDDTASVMAAYTTWCEKNSIVSEFVRFHPNVGNHKFVEGFYDVIPLGNVVVMDVSSEENIWANIISKNRNMIRKAQKHGVTIYNGRFPEILETFRSIYNSTMDKDEADPYYYFAPEFYNSILNDLPQNAQIFYAVYEEQVIAAAIMLSCNGKMTYHLSGSVREFSYLAATNLMLYQAALWGCANGCKTFYLGGGVGSEEDGLFKFKRSFYRGDDLPRFHVGRKIFNQDKYDELLALRDDVPDSNYFPLYRAKK